MPVAPVLASFTFERINLLIVVNPHINRRYKDIFHQRTCTSLEETKGKRIGMDCLMPRPDEAME